MQLPYSNPFNSPSFVIERPLWASLLAMIDLFTRAAGILNALVLQSIAKSQAFRRYAEAFASVSTVSLHYRSSDDLLCLKPTKAHAKPRKHTQTHSGSLGITVRHLLVHMSFVASMVEFVQALT